MQTNWYASYKVSKSIFTKEPIDGVEGIEDLDAYLARDPWEQVDSSFILEIAYFYGAGVLEIKMKNGQKYTFMGVPRKVYEAFKAAPSKGKFFNEIIKKRYVMD